MYHDNVRVIPDPDKQRCVSLYLWPPVVEGVGADELGLVCELYTSLGCSASPRPAEAPAVTG